MSMRMHIPRCSGVTRGTTPGDTIRPMKLEIFLRLNLQERSKEKAKRVRVQDW